MPSLGTERPGARPWLEDRGELGRGGMGEVREVYDHLGGAYPRISNTRICREKPLSVGPLVSRTFASEPAASRVRSSINVCPSAAWLHSRAARLTTEPTAP